ncbi:MAG: family protein phosphatase [Baekduia sp.]|jgi:protein phosphatase|nr:family protein phosphatase [Baekduia sp.]
MTALMLECAVRTDVGRRPNNEDSAFASPRLAAIADGVGGAAAGEVASRLVIDALVHLDKCRLDGALPDAVARAVEHGNATIGFVAACRPQLAGMSTTLTAIALDTDDGYVLTNVGDSRTYLLRDGVLRRLTRDDSFVQRLIDAGHVTEEQARTHPHRSVVLAALDGRPEALAAVAPAPTRAVGPARLGDRLLLCSDGLTDVVDDDDVAAVLRQEADRRAAAERLVALALDGGGRDNVSVVVADAVPRAGDRAGWPAPLPASSRGGAA